MFKDQASAKKNLETAVEQNVQQNILITNEVISSQTDADAILLFLKEQGYALIQKLGEGKTRAAFQAQYVKDGINTLRVVKIPFEKYDLSSVCTVINKSKRNLDQNEATMSNLLTHPNLVTIYDSFRFKNINLNVEEYFQQAQSLEETIGKTGAIKDHDKFMNIFSQVIAGVEYANFNDTNGDGIKLFREGILLRDIKPSNILVGIAGLVKLTDFQNSAKMEDIVELSFPTRGGTAYTRPDMINSLVTGQPGKATRQSEAYAVAASMYYALTGQDAFSYNIKEIKPEENGGVTITVGDKVHRIQLIVDGKEQNSISYEQHEASLNKALKSVPKKYRKMLYKGLTMKEGKSYEHVVEMKKDFEKLKYPTKGDFVNKLYSSVKPALITLATVSALGGMLILGKCQSERNPPQPTMVDILRGEDYSKFSLQTWNNSQDSLFTLDLLKDNFEDLKDDLPKLLKQIDGKETEELDYIKEMSRQARNVHMIDERLMTSLLASCYVNGWSQNDVDKIYTGAEDNGRRLDRTYVPRGFVLRNNTASGGGDHISIYGKSAFAAMYLKMCVAGQSIVGDGDSLTDEGNVAEVFANYFCNSEEINTAKARTQSSKYLPRVKNNFVEIGYGQFLDYKKTQLINDAIAIYLITDTEGNIDLKKIPELRGLYGQYKQTLTLPPN